MAMKRRRYQQLKKVQEELQRDEQYQAIQEELRSQDQQYEAVQQQFGIHRCDRA